MHISKLDAARRQLNVAICMLFDGCDPIAVHTLVGAASVIISDLVKKSYPDKSWDRFAQESNGITASQYFQVIRKQQNFLKHADYDAEATFDFDPEDTIWLAIFAVNNLGNFGTLSIEASVFQLWYFACHEPLDMDIPNYHKLAMELFGDLRNKSREYCLNVAKRILAEQLAKAP